MKIRTGFVSNSSSSSFIALAFTISSGFSTYRDLAIICGASEEEFDKKVAASMQKYDMKKDDAIREVCWCDYDDMLNEKGITILNGFDDGLKDKNGQAVALILAETSEYNGGRFDSGEVMMDKSDDKYASICELRDKINPSESIRIIYGTRQR